MLRHCRLSLPLGACIIGSRLGDVYESGVYAWVYHPEGCVRHHSSVCVCVRSQRRDSGGGRGELASHASSSLNSGGGGWIGESGQPPRRHRRARPAARGRSTMARVWRLRVAARIPHSIRSISSPGRRPLSQRHAVMCVAKLLARRPASL